MAVQARYIPRQDARQNPRQEARQIPRQEARNVERQSEPKRQEMGEEMYRNSYRHTVGKYRY